MGLTVMLKLTRLDHRVVAINPDHIAWVEATPDTTLCLLGDRKVIVRESLEEVIDRFVAARARVGCTAIPVAAMTPPTSASRRPGSSSSGYPRQSARPSAPAPQVIDGPASAPPGAVRFNSQPGLRRDEHGFLEPLVGGHSDSGSRNGGE